MTDSRIAGAVYLLDRHRPGWHNEINLALLDMQSMDRCILGQLYGDYATGINRLGLSDGYGLGSGFEYGFCKYFEDDTFTGPLWADEIIRRGLRGQQEAVTINQTETSKAMTDREAFDRAAEAFDNAVQNGTYVNRYTALGILAEFRMNLDGNSPYAG